MKRPPYWYKVMTAMYISLIYSGGVVIFIGAVSSTSQIRWVDLLPPLVNNKLDAIACCCGVALILCGIVGLVVTLTTQTKRKFYIHLGAITVAFGLTMVTTASGGLGVLKVSQITNNALANTGQIRPFYNIMCPVTMDYVCNVAKPSVALFAVTYASVLLPTTNIGAGNGNGLRSICEAGAQVDVNALLAGSEEVVAQFKSGCEECKKVPRTPPRQKSWMSSPYDLEPLSLSNPSTLYRACVKKVWENLSYIPREVNTSLPHTVVFVDFDKDPYQVEQWGVFARSMALNGAVFSLSLILLFCEATQGLKGVVQLEETAALTAEAAIRAENAQNEADTSSLTTSETQSQQQVTQ